MNERHAFWIPLFLCLIAHGLIAQTAEPAAVDELEKASVATTQTVAVTGETADQKTPEPDEAAVEHHPLEKEVLQLFDSYWKAIMEDRRDAAYSMYCQSYRDKVSLGDFFRQKQAKINSHQLRGIEFHTDECVEVSYFASLASGQMDLRNVPGRQIWFKEEGEWRLFDTEPERNIGGMGRPRPKLKPPCGRGSEAALAEAKAKAEKLKAERAAQMADQEKK